ncbi:fiber [Human adenovirus 32]|uniref:Fiber n=7 Tax=Human mastadenovirus D TaxID=130310 RepID=M0QUV7_9ADEN|nr:fiber [Human adenovirus 32]AFK92592.1 fiber [Human adenovirus 33]
MSKRLRVEDDFNPVYPYGYARNQNIPFLTPPFVSSDGFQNFPPGVLSLKLADPITIANGNVSLKVGGGLTLEQDSGKLIVNPKAPLQVANDKLELSYADPFETSANKLSLKVGHGLKVLDEKNAGGLKDLIGTLVVLTGKGIGVEELKNADNTNRGVGINVRLGKDGGLSFDKKGDLVAWNKHDDRRTLWTTPDPSPNCTIDEERDSKLTLVLTKCGSQILANVSLLVVKGKFSNINNNTNPTDKKITVKLLFNEKGVLMDSSSLKKEYWNYRNDNSTVSQAYDNAVPFMPNIKAYPKPTTDTSAKPEDKKSAAKRYIVSNVYIGGLPDKTVVITIKLNAETESAYSMTFEFTWAKTFENLQFDSSSFTFSYIAQENEDEDK